MGLPLYRLELGRPHDDGRGDETTDGNYSAWADFKEWMDVEFARAIERGTLAIHAADPARGTAQSRAARYRDGAATTIRASQMRSI